MASPSSSPSTKRDNSNKKFQVSNVPVVLEWQDNEDDDDDEHRHHLGHTLPLTLDAKLDTTNATASFKLRIVLSLKGAAKRVPLYLFIPPDAIASVTASPTPPSPITSTLLKRPTTTEEITRLTFTLTSPPLLIGPSSTPPVPQTGPSARALAALRSLVRYCPALSLHFRRPAFSDAFVETIVANAGGSSPSDCEGDRRPRKKMGGGRTQMAGDTKTVTLEIAGYEWSRGVDERVALLSGQLEALKKIIVGAGASAVATADAAAAAATPSTALEDDASKVAAAAAAANLPSDTAADDVCTRLARLESEMAAVRADVAAANTRWEELAEQLREQRKEDLEQLREQGKQDLEAMRWSIMEDMESLLARSRDEVVDEAECRMEDRFVTTKEELREAVEEECENAEERIKELLSSGAAGVYFEFPKS
ncbi:hypothetical protein UCDDS831_g07176 [Diplodia seriata]|uniref:Uncharacterized protein n=1 Tax=Diplodia seriata TaxID=420778 RepID=A0A0G2FWP5_9PEZI|nr:hypothetical protein UCDDS831_g07176 [Diplodia seriata]